MRDVREFEIEILSLFDKAKQELDEHDLGLLRETIEQYEWDEAPRVKKQERRRR